MKKLFTAALALAALALVVSCGSKTSSPGSAAKAYMEYLAAGDADRFVEGIHFDESLSAEEVEQSKAMWASLVQEKGKKSVDEKGGLESVEVISETISEDGQTANVELKLTFGNGDVEEEELSVMNVNGKWMMEASK